MHDDIDVFLGAGVHATKRPGSKNMWISVGRLGGSNHQILLNPEAIKSLIYFINDHMVPLAVCISCCETICTCDQRPTEEQS
jgi:hypothetical protein